MLESTASGDYTNQETPSLELEVLSPSAKRARFQRSVETKKIVDLLSQIPIGGIVPYEDLSELIGLDVRSDGSGYQFLFSARRILFSEMGILFDTIIKVGIRRMSDSEVVEAGEWDRSKQAKRSGIAKRKLSTVDYDTLTPEHKLKHNALMTLFSMVGFVLSPSRVRRLEQKVKDMGGGELPVGKTLDFFRGK